MKIYMDRKNKGVNCSGTYLGKCRKSAKICSLLSEQISQRSSVSTTATTANRLFFVIQLFPCDVT